VKRIALVLAAVVALAMVCGCTQTAPTPPAPAAPAVNGRPVTEARPCHSYLGQVLTAADETINCTDPNNTGDATYVQPASATPCDDGRTFIALGDAIGAIEGQEAAELPAAGWALDRRTCQVTP
jgi:hypothetical protein